MKWKIEYGTATTKLGENSYFTIIHHTYYCRKCKKFVPTLQGDPLFVPQIKRCNHKEYRWYSNEQAVRAGIWKDCKCPVCKRASKKIIVDKL